MTISIKNYILWKYTLIKSKNLKHQKVFTHVFTYNNVAVYVLIYSNLYENIIS